MTPTFHAIHPLFGAEVQGVDLSRPLPDAVFAAIADAFERRSVLLFRSQAVDDAAQVAFAARFGPLETVRAGAVGGGTHLITLTNVAPDGGILPPTHEQTLHGLANRLWHTDSSFKAIPALASLLSAREVPPEGGETEWAGTRAAFAALPDELRRRIDGLTVRHDFAHSRAKVDPDLAVAATRAAFPPVTRPLVRRNPLTGEAALYLGSHAAAVDGMGVVEGRALLDMLTRHATRPEFVYTHRWRPGDLVLWDNRATLHRGRPFAAGLHRRTIVRATIADPAGRLAVAA
ncbi:alpha-ketoglutarate-dependent 2,4-dichlorophenoxyacetate dioxygenase [Stella humosa]|uniref:Alpha-ketoglutarate-dependent 2,4-dichlorophenoxyacetate dioxygenase n=1 Tax=Stella humosa TaxID=94 RepID=A0A3N1KXZ1_9PROT|nr:TauD/TfdA family dioxygenase [Stella humosa]ROP83450.1 alpha-ketoglutarate-dependent 2,4-dichlorophenoxyacetate dioxygenase [Stella humosa]BBK33278.1 alpha-ketoglutarate-dependent 2,4-dichlorophenoxyacetate dioxygenase [Stella humosa]